MKTPTATHALLVEQQVRLLHGRVTIDKPKAGETRTVPLPDGLAVALAEHLRRHPAAPDELVATSREGARW